MCKLNSMPRLAHFTAVMKSPKKPKINRIAARMVVVHAWQKCRGDLDRVMFRTGKPRRYIVKWVQHFKKYRHVNDKRRCGRPHSLNAQQAGALSALVQQDKSVPVAAAQLRKEGVIPKSVSNRTALRAVSIESGFKTAVPRPLLTAAAKQKRLAFSKRKFRVGNLVAIDSSIFPLWGYQPRRGRWVLKGTRPTQPKPVRSQKLHVYAGISKHGKTKLMYVTGTTHLPKLYHKADGKQLYDGVCAQEFQDIMEQQLYPQAKAIMQRAGQPEPVFLMDGAPPHTARATTDFLQAKDIKYLHGWPPNSPDLNPIENLWAHLKREVYAGSPTSLAALKAALEAAWARVPDRLPKRLMASFTRRLKKCVERAGEHTGY
jgi:hypothetical protein